MDWNALACVFAGVVTIAIPSITAVVSKWLDHRRELALRELEIRAKEADARLVEAQARAALPEFLDAKDALAVEAWQKARREVGAREL